MKTIDERLRFAITNKRLVKLTDSGSVRSAVWAGLLALLPLVLLMLSGLCMFELP